MRAAASGLSLLLSALAAGPALAAITPPTTTSGASTDGSVMWSTATNGIASVPGAYTPSMPSDAFYFNTSSSASYGTGANAVTIATTSSDAYGLGNNNSGFTNVVAPDGTLLQNQSFYYSESKSTSVGGTLTYTFSTPQKFFGALVNDAVGADYVKVYSGGNVVLNLNFDTISSFNSSVGSIGLYSAYLNIDTDGTATINKVEFDFGPNRSGQFSNYSKVADPSYSVNTPYVAPASTSLADQSGQSVDEPSSVLGCLGLAALGLFGFRRREGSVSAVA